MKIKTSKITRYILLLIIILVLSNILLILYKKNRYEKFSKEKNLIFTCSTYFTKKNRYEQFCKAIDSIQEKSLINRFIVINEYDDNDSTDYTSLVKTKYPYIEFYQKNKDNKGQARTLNIILDLIKPYKYWIHWEESWYANTPFISNAISIMNNNKSITQLQFTPDWLDIDKSRHKEYNGYTIISLDPLYYQLENNVNNYNDLEKLGLLKIWPLYSLRPSINRVSHYKNIGYFMENKDLWPVRFEYEYSIRWINAGCVKAIINPPVAFRNTNHISSYH